MRWHSSWRRFRRIGLGVFEGFPKNKYIGWWGERSERVNAGA